MRTCSILVLTTALAGLGAPAAEDRGLWATTNFLDEPFAVALYSVTDEAGYSDPAATVASPSVRMQEVESQVSLPVWSGGADLVLAGAAANWNRFEFDDPAVGDEDLYGLSLPLGWVHQGEGPWGGWVSLAPGVFGDLEGNGDDFKVQGLALATWQRSPRLAFALGGAYDSAFGEDRLYPMGGLTWRAGEDWMVNLVLPYASVWWKPGGDWAAFLDLRPAGDTWKVDGDSAGERMEFTLETWRMGAGLERRLWSGVWLHIAGGCDVARHYEFTQDGRTVLDADADDGWFVRAGLVLR